MKTTISFLIAYLMACCAYAQDLYIGTFYVATPDEEKLYGDGNDKWNTRLPVISEMFNFEQPDVLGLQSLTEDQRTALAARMETFNQAGDIFYNNSLELDSCGAVAELPEGKSCSWAVFRKEGKAFCVFNLCFDADTSNDNMLTLSLFKAIAEVNTDDLPCFIIGNIESGEKGTIYSRLVSRYSDCFNKASVVSAEFGTKNNFDLEANHGTNRFDFVFAPKNAAVGAYGQLQYGYYTPETGGTYKRRLPSTHFPVMAKVTLP